MNNLERAKRLAQSAADREQKPQAVLNLNRFSPLYVVRTYDATTAASDRFVCKVEPQSKES